MMPERRKLQVLHVLGAADVAGTGISNMVRQLARNLEPAEFSFTACFLDAEGPWLEALRAAGVVTAHIPWSSPTDLMGAWRFWRFLRANPVDVVHLHHGGRSVRRLAKLASGAPLVFHRHGRVRSELDYRPLPLRLDDVEAVVATSRAVAGVTQARLVTVVYPGVPVSRAPAMLRSSHVIGAAGRLEAIKGYDVLLEAFAEVRQGHPEMRLEIAGDGSQLGTLRQQALALRIDDAVSFPGWVDDLPAAIRRWSIHVQPSREEAFGITVLQAMAEGVPVIASDVGGLAEIVEPGMTGLLVPAGDAQALAAAMKQLLDDPERRETMGAASRQSAARFSEARFARELAALYRGLTAPG
jgi:glycosyltransferase involved in cell wall biosynthesis